MRTIDFCFPLPEYEYPRLVSYRHLFEACASPVANGLAPATRRPVDLAFHDAESASVGSSGFARNVFLCAPPSSRTFDTPVATELPASHFRAKHSVRFAEAASSAPP